MVALRHLEYLQFEIFMARTARTANMSNVVKIGQPFAELLRFFDFFFKMAVARLDLFVAYSDHPRTVLRNLSY